MRHPSLPLIVLTFAVATACADDVEAVKPAEGVKLSAIAPGFARNTVNVQVYRKHSLVTSGDTQFAAFYDGDGRVDVFAAVLDVLPGEEPVLDVNELLRHTVEKGASDLHITTGSAPQLRIDGDLAPLHPGEPPAQLLGLGPGVGGHGDRHGLGGTPACRGGGIGHGDYPPVEPGTKPDAACGVRHYGAVQYVYR